MGSRDVNSLKHQKILLTGASGFIGSHVLEELLQSGYNEHVVVHCGKVSGHPSVTLHLLDLFDNAAAEKLVSEQRFTHLLHLAWYMGAGAHAHNLNMTWSASSLRLLESFARHGGTHFLGAGTCAEYEYKYGLMREDETPTNPSSLYGCCKNAFYRSARLFCVLNDIHFQWIRPFNCYGPGDEGSYRVIPSVIADCLRGNNVRVSECKNYKDFIYVKDAVRGIVDVVESPLSGAVNICSGLPVQKPCSTNWTICSMYSSSPPISRIVRLRGSVFSSLCGRKLPSPSRKWWSSWRRTASVRGSSLRAIFCVSLCSLLRISPYASVTTRKSFPPHSRNPIMPSSPAPSS